MINLPRRDRPVLCIISFNRNAIRSNLQFWITFNKKKLN